jgi:hypothetical protein
MDKESGLIMATWPKGRLKIPFPYFAESMSGFEYAAAVGMIYEGQTNAGLQCIASIRNRFDGEKRNPFDEPECGHHYARAMASWSAILALTGFQYSGVDHAMSFDVGNGQYFWSNGYSWGMAYIQKARKQATVELKVLSGELEIKTFELKGYPVFVPKTATKIKVGDSLKMTF